MTESQSKKFLSGDNTYIQPRNSVSVLIPVFCINNEITHTNEWIPFYTHERVDIRVNRTVTTGMREFHQTEPECDHQMMDQRFT